VFLRAFKGKMFKEGSTIYIVIVVCRKYHIPQDFTICETAENALFHIPERQPTSSAVWIGYIPTPQRYEAVYKAALSLAVS
jgi:hypothetical protein